MPDRYLPDYSCTGTVINMDDYYYVAIKDGYSHDIFGAWATAYHREWTVLADQQPNPDHAAVVAEYRSGGGELWRAPEWEKEYYDQTGDEGATRAA